MSYPLYSTNAYLSLSQMRGNAQYVMDFFQARGWSKNAIAAMLGNMQVESTINPGLWQGFDEFDYDGGYGLVQWTPASKYIDWAASDLLITAYEDYKQIEPQCLRIIWELENDEQWESGILTFYEFSRSTADVRWLSDRFCYGYERPADPDLELRADQSEYWFSLLDYGPKKSFGLLYMMKKPRIYGG